MSVKVYKSGSGHYYRLRHHGRTLELSAEQSPEWGYFFPVLREHIAVSPAARRGRSLRDWQDYS